MDEVVRTLRALGTQTMYVLYCIYIRMHSSVRNRNPYHSTGLNIEENILTYIICSKAGKFSDGWIQWLHSVIKDLCSFYFSALSSSVGLFILSLVLLLITRWLKSKRSLFVCFLPWCVFSLISEEKLSEENPFRLILMPQEPILSPMPSPNPLAG